MRIRFLRRVVAFSFVLFPVASLAGEGLAQLERFVEQAARAEGRFEQTVTAPSGRQPQASSGSFAFERPGKFRWEYGTPYPQLLVSDGEQLRSEERREGKS